MQLCSPTVLYIAFSGAIVLSDTLKGLRAQALIRLITSFLLGLGIEFLCRQGLTVLSWMIVFIPFIAMSVITALILLALGIDAGGKGLSALEPASHAHRKQDRKKRQFTNHSKGKSHSGSVSESAELLEIVEFDETIVNHPERKSHPKGSSVRTDKNIS